MRYATLAYLSMLWQVAMYRGMTLERYMTYRSESLRGITARYNKCEESMHDVLAFAQKMLYEDMSNYLKLLSHVAPAAADKVGDTGGAPSSMDVECMKCEKLKRLCDQAKAESANKGMRITEMESELARLRADVRRERWQDRGELFCGRDRERDSGWDTVRKTVRATTPGERTAAAPRGGGVGS